MNMSLIEKVVSQFLYGQDSPPASLDNPGIIRPDGDPGDDNEVSFDANDFMTTGGGRFASVAQFKFVRRFLAGNDYKDPLSPGHYSTAELLGEYGKDYDKADSNSKCNTGSARYNMMLSRQRAQSVADELVAHGVNYGRVRVRGFGENDPVASNGSASGRALNCRVELTLSPAAG